LDSGFALGLGIWFLRLGFLGLRLLALAILIVLWFRGRSGRRSRSLGIGFRRYTLDGLP
jgi:hypothetical protein